MIFPESDISKINTEKTGSKDFFQQEVGELAEKLVGMTVVGPNGQIKIVEVQVYKTEENQGVSYKRVRESEPGNIVVAMVSGHRIVLVSALENGVKGACIKIQAAIGAHGEMLTPGKIAPALGLTYADHKEGLPLILENAAVIRVDTTEAMERQIEQQPSTENTQEKVDQSALENASQFMDDLLHSKHDDSTNQ